MTDRSVEAVCRRWVRTAVMHGVADIDARWKTVEDDATDLVLQDVHKISVVQQVLLRSVNGRREMSIEPGSKLDHLITALAFVNR